MTKTRSFEKTRVYAPEETPTKNADQEFQLWMRSSQLWMRSSQLWLERRLTVIVKNRNSPGFDASHPPDTVESEGRQ
jgi:hypothetical protein